MPRRSVVLLAFGAVILVAAVTVGTFEEEVYRVTVSSEFTDAAGDPTDPVPVDYADLSADGQAAFSGAFEAARESGSVSGDYAIRGDWNLPPEFADRSLFGTRYRVQYRGSAYQLSLSGAHGTRSPPLAIGSLLAGLVGVRVFGVGLSRESTPRILATALASVCTVVALAATDGALPGYLRLPLEVGFRILTLAALAGLLWGILHTVGVVTSKESAGAGS
jgi:hypothetical protein